MWNATDIEVWGTHSCCELTDVNESRQSNNEGEVGLKLSLTMKAQTGHTGIAPLSLKLDARRRSVVNVTLRPLYPRGRTVTPMAVQVG